MAIDASSGKYATKWPSWLARIRPVVWLAPLMILSIYTAYWLRFDGNLPPETASQLWQLIPLVVFSKTVAFVAMRLTLSCHSFVSMHDAYRLLKATFVATATVAVLDRLFFTDENIPRGVILIDGCLTALLVGGVLSVRRTFRERREMGNRPRQSKRALVVSGPAGAELLIRAIRQSRNSEYSVVGILTDSERLQHREIAGISVVGRLNQIEQLASDSRIEMLLLSAGDLPGSEVRRIVDSAESLNVEVKVVPDVSKIVTGQIDFRPREVAIEDLLGRPTVEIDQTGLSDWLSGKRLLVTGSCGSIGSELVRQLLNFNPAHITLVDRSENGQFHLGRELHDEIKRRKVEIVLADVTDLGRMNGIFRKYQPEIVFHAAAYKHVPMLEHHPGEGIENIISATKVVADLSHACGVEKFVMISTDKAVNPTSVMGCCKRVAELYVQSMSKHSKCRFVTVRFGNVLGSAGSVIPIFREQIAHGGPITITHPDMTRYFMTIPEASQLVIQAAAIGNGGDIYVLDMGSPVKIIDLAKDMIQLSGLRVDHDIELQIAGLRPGEKLYEELYCDSETRRPTKHPKILVADSPIRDVAAVQASIASIIDVRGASHDVICEQLSTLVPSFTFQRENLDAAAKAPIRRAA